MIGRMSSLQFHQSSLDVLLDAQVRLQRTQEELATGKRILSPSDDPVSTAQILTLRSELSRVETYQRNIDTAANELASTETTVAAVEDVLYRARELALMAGNPTLNDANRSAIATEIDGLRDQLINLANTTTASGEFLFAGFATDAAAFSDATNQADDDNWVDIGTDLYVDNAYLSQVTYEGDTNVRQVNIANGVTISTRVAGEELFGESLFAVGNTTATANAFEALGLLAQGVRSQLPAPPAQTPLGNDVDSDVIIDAALSGIDSALERASNVRADLGVRMNRVDDQASLHYDFSLSISKTISGLEDVDYAKAVSDLSARMLALESAQKAYSKMQGISLFNYL